ncbi:hypothetical protein ACQ4M3_41410 [Leptolyngbya sp. AN03gr2]|uniref:hypothetical protein n=1 Tax=unclassified Leptolyngbya TaxID=2650499 RepID=UPI003D31ED82
MMNETKLCQRLIALITQRLTEIADRAHRQRAIAAFDSGDARTVKLLALTEPHDRFLDSLSFLCGARKLASSNPVTALTTIQGSIKALVDVSDHPEMLWNEAQSCVRLCFDSR